MKFCTFALYLIGCIVSVTISQSTSGCNISYEESQFMSLFAELENYVINPEAKQTIQWILDGVRRGESPQCDLECQKKSVYVYGIEGTTKLKSQVSENIGRLLSKFIAIDTDSLERFEQVSPNDAAGIMAIGCNVLKNKNQLLQQAYCSPNLLC